MFKIYMIFLASNGMALLVNANVFDCMFL